MSSTQQANNLCIHQVFLISTVYYEPIEHFHPLLHTRTSVLAHAWGDSSLFWVFFSLKLDYYCIEHTSNNN